MTAMTPPLYLQAGSHPADRDRQGLRSIIRPGVVPGTSLAVSQKSGTPDMSVDVAEGRIVVLGTENTYQGVYHCEAQGVTNVPLTAADPTNPRRDLIIARVRDSLYSGGTDTFSIERVTGTPAGSPVDPSVAALGSVFVLARVAVAAGATSIVNANVTDFRAGGTGYTSQQGASAALGGVVVCTSTLRPTTGLYNGLVAYETDTGRLIVYDGTRFILVPTAAAAEVITNEGTASASFVDLTTPGPSVTVLTGTRVMVTAYAQFLPGGGVPASIGVVVSGATTIAVQTVIYNYPSGGNGTTTGICLISTLTPGLNTFKLQYATTTGTSNFLNRRILVQPVTS